MEERKSGLILPPGLNAKPAEFHCPECKTVRPSFGFHLNRQQLGIIGYVEYFTIFCAAVKDPTAKESAVCGCIFNIMLTTYQPPNDPDLMRQLAGAMAAGKKGGES